VDAHSTMSPVTGVMAYLKAFRGDGIEDRRRPNQTVGIAFLVAALAVALIGLKWMGSGSGTVSAAGNGGWRLGGYVEASGGTTTIPLSPAAQAVQVGAQGPGSTDDRSGSTVTSMLPDGTPIVISGPGSSSSSTGSTGSPSTGPGGTTRTTKPVEGTTTSFTTVESTDPPTTPTTEPPTTEPPTTEPPTTEPPTTDPTTNETAP
jgi:hypothetical protein